MLIADLRKEMGLSLEAFAAELGLESRGRMSVIERENRCSLRVALAIEELSGRRIDAADLCEDVRLARHAAANTAPQQGPATGQTTQMSGHTDCTGAAA